MPSTKNVAAVQLAAFNFLVYIAVRRINEALLSCNYGDWG